MCSLKTVFRFIDYIYIILRYENIHNMLLVIDLESNISANMLMSQTERKQKIVFFL